MTKASVKSRAVFEDALEPLCAKEGLGVITYFSLASGFLTGKYRSKKDLEGRSRAGEGEKHMTPRGQNILAAPDEAAIRGMVRRIIDERLDDGQFDECDLTLRDLDRVREAFVAQLLGMYHRRIEYPQNKIVELESRRAANESTGKAG